MRQQLWANDPRHGSFRCIHHAFAESVPVFVQVETTVNAMKRIASGNRKMQQRDTLRMAVSIAFVQRALRRCAKR